MSGSAVLTGLDRHGQALVGAGRIRLVTLRNNAYLVNNAWWDPHRNVWRYVDHRLPARLIVFEETGSHTHYYGNPGSAPNDPITWGFVGDVVVTDAPQTLFNKTLSSPTLDGTVGGDPTFSGQVTLAAPILTGSVPQFTLAADPTAALQVATKQYVDAAVASVLRTANATVDTTETTIDSINLTLPAGATRLIAGASYSMQPAVSTHTTFLRLYVAGTVYASVRAIVGTTAIVPMSLSAIVTGLTPGGTVTIEVRGQTSLDSSTFLASAADPSILWVVSIR